MHLASQKSALVKELVDSGDLYQPLAWTPREAYRFLKDVPVLRGERRAGAPARLVEEAASAARGVTIGDARQKKFDADAMLDFQVRLALGDQELTRSRMARTDGGRRRTGAAPRPMGRGRSREAGRGARPLEKVERAGQRRTLVYRRACGCWPVRPTDLADDGDGRSRRPPVVIRPGRASGSATCSQDCAARRASQPLDTRQRPEGDAAATTRRRASAGCGSCPRLGLGACLADDMGLGKTIQVLALLAGA